MPINLELFTLAFLTTAIDAEFPPAPPEDMDKNLTTSSTEKKAHSVRKSFVQMSRFHISRQSTEALREMDSHETSSHLSPANWVWS